METRVLQSAGREVSEFVGEAARVLSTDWSTPSRCVLILEDVESGTRHKLILDLAQAHPAAHLDGISKQEVHRGGFAQRLRGSFLVEVEASSNDRWWELTFRKPKESENESSFEVFSLIVAWIGNRYNAWLLDEDRVILERACPRGLLPGRPFIPPAKDPRPLGHELPSSALVDRLCDTVPERWTRVMAKMASDWTPARALDLLLSAVESCSSWIDRDSQRIPFESGSIAALGTAVIEAATKSSDAVPAETALYEVPAQTEISIPIEGVGKVFAAGLGLPLAFVVSPPLSHLEAYETRRIDKNESLSPLLSKAYRVCLRGKEELERRAFFERFCSAEMKRLFRLRNKLSEEILDENYGKRLRQHGETILANLHGIEKGADRLVAPNLYEEGSEPFEIELDPRSPASTTAEKLFRTARRWEKSRRSRQARIAILDESIAALSVVHTKILDANSLQDDDAPIQWIKKALGTFFKRTPDLRARQDRTAKVGRTEKTGTGRSPSSSNASRRNKGGETKGGGGKSGAGRTSDDKYHPRRYETASGWTVIVGRSNEENDYVTHRMGKQEDYWFHAHGVPGSHVLLKRDGRKDNPSRKTIREAAAIAAFFSKARHSSRVPVIYTLKKHVRKPRKAKAGLAQCTHEQTIMVGPWNPEGSKPLED